MSDAETVERLRRMPEMPFEFRTAEGQIIRCVELLRHLPEKRLVCRATVDGKDALVKLYVDRNRARVHAERELTGARAMAERGIETPALLQSGSVGDGVFVAYEWISDAPTALSLRDQIESKQLLHMLTATVAAHHNAGLLQRDMHLGNFLLRGDTVYTLDAAEIAVEEEPISRESALDNLALLYVQFPVEFESQALDAFTCYAERRDWCLDEDDLLAALKQRIVQHRDQRERDYANKVFRQSTAFVAARTARRYYVCDRQDYDLLRPVLEQPERLFEAAQYLKRGNTATVALAHIGDKAVVVKRYNLKNFGHAISRALRESRAATSWRNAHRLLLHGIATPRPIALIEERFGPIRRVAYLVTEYDDGIPASAYFAQADVIDEEVRRIAAEIIALLFKLERLRISHGDLKSTNILVHTDRISLIDLDGMRKHGGPIPESVRRRDIDRFLKNWDGLPQVAELFSSLLANRNATTPLQTRNPAFHP